MKEEKLYLTLEDNWEDFCTNRLGMSRAYADKIIRQLRDLGPQFFKLSSFAKITPAEYRRISFAVTEDGLTHNGQTIPLEAGHSPQPMEAVDVLRAATAIQAPPADPAEESFAKAEKSVRAAVAEFQRLQEMSLDEEGRLKLAVALETGRDELERIRVSTGL